MPVFIPKGATPEERKLDSKRFSLQLSITYTLLFLVPIAFAFTIPPKWSTGSAFGDMSLCFGWMMFSFMTGSLLSDLYVKHKTVCIRRKDVLELFTYCFIAPSIAGMLLAGIVLYVHNP
jgi:hypothetical protein